MNYTKKKLEDMDVMDDFLMGQLASDESYGADFCRLIVSTLLQKKACLYAGQSGRKCNRSDND